MAHNIVPITLFFRNKTQVPQLAFRGTAIDWSSQAVARLGHFPHDLMNAGSDPNADRGN